MTSKLNPYLNFEGNAREAMEFYNKIFGGKLNISTFGESGMSVSPDEKDQVMHAHFAADNGITLMASDIPSGWEYKPGNNVSLSLSGDNEQELQGYWDKLAQGGNIEQPLEQAPWGDRFGMLTDKFGIRWLVNISPKKP